MKNLSLNAKIAAVIGLFAAGILVAGYIAVTKMASLNESTSHLANVVSERVRLAVNLDADTNSLMNLEKQMLLEENTSSMRETAGTLDEKVAHVQAGIDSLGEIATESGRGKVEVFRQVFSDWQKTDARIRDLALSGKTDQAFTLIQSTGKEHAEKFTEILGDIRSENESLMNEEKKNAQALFERNRNLLFAVNGVTLFFACLIGFFVLRGIHKSMNRVIGDLTDSSHQVSSAAKQIAASSEQLSQASTEQASSVQETSSSVTEINSMVKRNRDNAQQSAQAAREGQKTAEKGKQTVDEMVQAINDINESNRSVMDQVNESNENIQNVVKVIDEIGEKTKVINDIVFQTKLLSFNASVEAARAGEHGKGFAVVAEEVGKLAQMSGKAANEIADMLETSTQRVESTISESKQKVEGLIQQSREKVDRGTNVANQCGEVLDEVVKKSSEITEMVDSIASASNEQSEGVEQINQAITQIDQATQTNASGSEEAASAAEELSAQTEAMNKIIDDLVMAVKGSGTESASADSAPKADPQASGPAVDDSDKKVVPMARKKEPATQPPEHQPADTGFKKAAGMENVPTDDDPRFKEV